MNYIKTAFLVLVAVNISCTSQEPPSEQPPTKRWVKGNLHTHSYWSDGDEFPEVIMDWYKSSGYQFIALSDHNILAQGEKWIVVPEDSIYQAGFANYLKNYGPGWVEHKEDTGHIQVKLKTYDEYKERFEEPEQFLIIPSEEITDRFEDKPLHMNATNIQTKIDPRGGNSVKEVLQNNINAVLEQREQTGEPIVPHINHPNFGYAISLEDMMALRGERFFEVYNGHHMVNNLGDSTHMSTEEMWDLINISYLESDQPLMYGLATDDSHNYHVMGSEWSNAGRGWIMVQVDSLSPSALIASMEAGEFYASTGVVLRSLSLEENRLSIEVAEEPGVTYTISFIGCKQGQSQSEELMAVEATQAQFEITDDLLFVRCKISSTKLHNNPIEELLYETAWTQPVTSKK